MPLTALPASPDDASSSITIENAAYAGGPLSGILFPGPFPAETSSNSRPAQLAQELREDPTVRFWKVVDTGMEEEGKDGRIAFAKWLVRDENWEPKEREFGEGSNVEACRILFGQMAEAYNERWLGKAHVRKSTLLSFTPEYVPVLSSALADHGRNADFKLLHTLPEQQGRGAGSLLLKAAAEEADKLGLPAYLEATEAGKPLYEKFGFKECGRVIGDFSKWGGPKAHVNYLMVRDAKA
jgi:GNAT superfamily N-acetyltransferase